MNHKLGMHWMRIHPDNPVDFAHVRAMQYPSFTLFKNMWDDPGFCEMLLDAALKDAIFLLRDHELSEQKQFMYSNPQRAGSEHALQWLAKKDAHQIHLPLDRCFFLGINEPDSNVYQPGIDAYTYHFVTTLDRYRMRAAAWSFGVGHPSTYNLHPEKSPNWEWYALSAKAIMATGSIALVHEYWMPYDYLWGKWAARYMDHCPFNIPYVVGECFIDSGVVGKFPSRGYRDYWQPEEYHEVLENLDNYLFAMQEDPRFHSAQPFTYDTNDDWTTFDIRPIAKLMESYPWRKGEPKPLPKVEPPVAVSTGAKPASAKQVLLVPIADGAYTTTQRFGENPADYAKYGIPGHNGWDLAAPKGTPVLAIADGIVQWTGFDKDYGNYVRVFHRDYGFHSFYAHLDSIRDGISGKTVSQGDVLGTVGSTGNSSGPHLHLEIRLAYKGGEYAEGQAGYGKGRVDPYVVYQLFNRGA